MEKELKFNIIGRGAKVKTANTKRKISKMEVTFVEPGRYTGSNTVSVDAAAVAYIRN